MRSRPSYSDCQESSHTHGLLVGTNVPSLGAPLVEMRGPLFVILGFVSEDTVELLTK